MAIYIDIFQNPCCKSILLDMVLADCRPLCSGVLRFQGVQQIRRSQGATTRVFPLFFDDDPLEGEWPGGVGVPSVYEGRRVPTSVFPLFIDNDLLGGE